MTAKKKPISPDPTIMRVLEQLSPLLNEYLNREAATSHLRAQIAARELELREKELELREKEIEIDHAERRQRLAERQAAQAKAAAEVARD